MSSSGPPNRLRPHRLGRGGQGLVGGVNGPGVGAQRGPGLAVFAQQVVAGVAGQLPDRLDELAERDAQDPAGAQREDQRHHGDRDGRAEGRLLQAQQQQRVGELVELLVELGHHHGDPEHHEGVADPHAGRGRRTARPGSPRWTSRGCAPTAVTSSEPAPMPTTVPTTRRNALRTCSPELLVPP